MRKLLLNTACLATLVAGPALAAPLTTNPGSLAANGTVNAVFAFADAGDESQLLSLSVGGVIFNNRTDAVGTTKLVGNAVGQIQFQLDNLSGLYSFVNDVADTGSGGDGFFHAQYGTTAASFGVTFSTATNNAIAALASQGPVTLVGFEDRRGGDYDYNDLIFAFSSVQVAITEPASLALLGLGLFGLGMLRRSRPG